MIKRLLANTVGLILSILFIPFKGMLAKRQEKLKTQYYNEPTSVQDHEAYFILKDLAWEVYYAGNLDEAKKLSKELIRLNKNVEKNWNYGNAIHHSHTILGLVCFDQGQ